MKSVFGELGSKVRARRGLLLAALVFTVLSVWMLERGALPLFPDEAAWQRTPAWPGAAFFFLALVFTFLRAERCRYLLEPIADLPAREVIAVNLVFLGANFVLPLRLAELVRPALLRRPGKLSGWQIIGVTGAERIIDGLLASVLLVTCLEIAPPTTGDVEPMARLVPPTAWSSLLFFVAGLSVLLAFYLFRGWARRVLCGTVGLVSLRAANFVADKLERVAEGLEFFRHGRAALAFVVSSLVFWLLHTLSLWCLLWGVGIPGGFAEAGVLLGVLAIGMLVPSGPGFFGIFQVSAYAALSLYSPMERVRAEGSVAVFLLYLGYLVSSVGPALLAWPLSYRALVRSLGAAQPPETSEKA